MTISISESGVTFGPFAPEDCYHIEASTARLALGKKAVKIAEFAVKLQTTNGESILALVEAKSSIPREPDGFFAEIREKLVNTFTLLMLASMGRQLEMSSELPASIRELPLDSCRIHLFLVIPNIPDEYLPPIMDKFRKLLQVERKTWALHESDLWVLNERTARLRGLIN